MDRLLLRTDEKASALGEPGQCPFHYPAARRVARLAVGIKLLRTDTPDRWGVLLCRHRLMPCGMVIALVQAEVLGLLLGRQGALHDKGLESGGQQLGGMDSGPGDGGAQRASRRLNHAAPFHPLWPRSVG